MRLSILSMLMSSVTALGAFEPVIESVEVSHRLLRPGDRAIMKIVFVNKGDNVATGEYRVFTHVEKLATKCDDILGHHDHEPTDLPTTLWQKGQRITDGPIFIGVPPKAEEGEYLVHVGVFDLTTGKRYVESYDGGVITISRKAPLAEHKVPSPLPATECAKREQALSTIPQSGVLGFDTSRYSVRVQEDGSRLWLMDKRSGEVWNHYPEGLFGMVSYRIGEASRAMPLLPFTSVVREGETRLAFKKAIADGLSVTVVLEATEDGHGLRFALRGQESGESKINSVELLRRAFMTTNNFEGASTIGFRTGERFVASRAPRPGKFGATTYNYSSTLAMVGQEKNGSALLLAWSHPESSYTLERQWTTNSGLPGTVVHSFGFNVTDLAADLVVYPLGKGSYVDIAKAYRAHVDKRGLLKTWKQKRATDGPNIDKMHGCADFKPFVYTHTVPTSRYNRSGKDERYVNWTLEEISQIAEHLNGTLGIDRAMMVLCGWINGGYDNGHPDPLPVAPELGGNEELVKTSERVRKTGFLFGMHDNYQDMYEAAPSWNPDFVAKRADGKKLAGGNWAGGPCWLVCASKQVELAARPDTNLPKIAELFNPTIYFIDTIFAAPLYSCYDPNHPNTRFDDMNNKIKLCQLGKKHFGVFGSEEGREWAVPYADYFEGVFSHRANIRTPERTFFSHAGGDLIPLLEMVFGDCVNLYTHQSDRAIPGRNSFILACIAHAETPLYNFGSHLYFKQRPPAKSVMKLVDVSVKAADKRKITIDYTWTTSGDMSDGLRCFTHFTHPAAGQKPDNIAFQDDHDLVTGLWKAGETRTITRNVTIPEEYNDDITLRIGVFRLDGKGRQPFTHTDGGQGEHQDLGQLVVGKDGTVRFTPVAAGKQYSQLSRADNGWAEDFNVTDRFIKNTYEVTSWIARLAAHSPMTDHRFLNEDCTVEYSCFDDMHIWINESEEPFVVDDARVTRFGGPVTLQPDGFLAVSPTFAAFHALSFGGRNYTMPVLFTVRALEGDSLEQASSIRVFHGFGDDRLQLFGKEHSVRREAVIRK